MIFSEILVLFLALVIAITLVLMLRKLFFGRKTKIQIDKKVNSRELFERVGSENSEKEILQDDNLDELPEDDVPVDVHFKEYSEEIREDQILKKLLFRG